MRRGSAPRRPELRSALGASPDDVVVLSVARLAPEKGLDVLVRAVAEAGRSPPRARPRGRRRRALPTGGTRERARRAARPHGRRRVGAHRRALRRGRRVRAALGARAVGGRRQRGGGMRSAARPLGPRGCGARPPPRWGERRRSSQAGDVDAAAHALRELAADPERRRAQGARSRELARDWGYGPSVEGFLDAVREAVADRS